MKFLGVIGAVGVRAVIAQPRKRSVSHDRKKPGPGGFPTKARKSAQRFEIRFLNYVFGIMRIARQETSQIVRCIKMRQEKVFETGACIGSGHSSVGNGCASRWLR